MRSIRSIGDHVISWIIGVVLLMGAIPHLANPYLFLGAVYQYDIASPALGAFAAIWIPFLQCVVGMCLLANCLREAAHAIAGVVLAVFVSVQLKVLLDGKSIPCGCFGTRYQSEVGTRSLMLVSGLLALSLVWHLMRWYGARRMYRIEN